MLRKATNQPPAAAWTKPPLVAKLLGACFRKNDLTASIWAQSGRYAQGEVVHMFNYLKLLCPKNHEVYLSCSSRRIELNPSWALVFVLASCLPVLYLLHHPCPKSLIETSLYELLRRILGLHGSHTPNSTDACLGSNIEAIESNFEELSRSFVLSAPPVTSGYPRK